MDAGFHLPRDYCFRLYETLPHILETSALVGLSLARVKYENGISGIKLMESNKQEAYLEKIILHYSYGINDVSFRGNEDKYES